MVRRCRLLTSLSRLPAGRGADFPHTILRASAGGTKVNKVSSSCGVRFQVNLATYCGCAFSVVVVMTSLRGRGYRSARSRAANRHPLAGRRNGRRGPPSIELGPTSMAALISSRRASSVPQKNRSASGTSNPYRFAANSNVLRIVGGAGTRRSTARAGYTGSACGHRRRTAVVCDPR